MSAHSIGRPETDTDPGPYGDVRDVLAALPHHRGGEYWRTDMFPVKHAYLAEHAPDARSVFEFGALVGYFLVTALDACPGIERVAWVDSELHTPGSNLLCEANVRAALADRLGVRLNAWSTSVLSYLAASHWRKRYDVVQVDGEHSLHACLVDLSLALAMRPKLILVDDTDAIAEVREAVELFAGYVGLEPEYHATVNGFAVLRP